ncbi:MAG TPA: Rrf2 family transcriptional regulator [Candidatus Acidoferrum sp.]|jgi:Rrf2 family protein|nr:Rrf2 family transcriptional regulator [Candidatus Acidoferrum sp.]
MRVTAKGEYATQAVLHLSMQYPEVVAIHDVATRHHIPLKYLEQILLELKRGGVLESRRGVHGGYTLARPPAQISVGEVLRLVDGAFAESSCTHAEDRIGSVCAEGPNCGLKQLWQDVQDSVEKILFATSFEDVKQRTLRGPASTAAPCISQINATSR